jgi:hypothetical protein
MIIISVCIMGHPYNSTMYNTTDCTPQQIHIYNRGTTDKALMIQGITVGGVDRDDFDK